MLSLKLLFFPDYPQIPSEEELEEQEKSRVRRLVALFSRGNISLANGKFTTFEDIEQQKKKLKNYEF